MRSPERWSVAESLRLYRVANWGKGIFGADEAGFLCVYPFGPAGARLNLQEVLRDAQSRGLGPPLRIHLPQVLHMRVRAIQAAFQRAIARHRYQGEHLCVYPIKVNPQRPVVELILNSGPPQQMGLEVGSKPELQAALSVGRQAAWLISNGSRDEASLELLLKAQRLGQRVCIVLEKLSELEFLLRCARRHNVRPQIGVRVRLSIRGAGKWEDSSGERSKFGLNAAELLALVAQLREAGLLDTLILLHTHPGSQFTRLAALGECLTETARYYVELRRLGCPVRMVDVGGGLGVDYNGTRSDHGFSMDYDEDDYAETVVATLSACCRQEGLPHPMLLNESGRAITAQHALLAVEVTSARSPANSSPAAGSTAAETHAAGTARLEQAQADRTRALRQDFLDGRLTLEERVRLESALEEQQLERGASRNAASYFCNFSLFQSLPDSWALNQEFPIVPLQRLGERPVTEAILNDITCDSDGRIRRYVHDGVHPGVQDHTHSNATGLQGIAHAPPALATHPSLPLHTLETGQAYHLAILLTGAYQEVLGEAHNLLGVPATVHVLLEADGSWRYTEQFAASSVDQMLRSMQYDPAQLRQGMDPRLWSLYERELRKSVYPAPAFSTGSHKTKTSPPSRIPTQPTLSPHATPPFRGRANG